MYLYKFKKYFEFIPVNFWHQVLILLYTDILDVYWYTHNHKFIIYYIYALCVAKTKYINILYLEYYT